MKKERRWMTSVLKEAARTKVELPWARGARRQTFIEQRKIGTSARSAQA